MLFRSIEWHQKAQFLVWLSQVWSSQFSVDGDVMGPIHQTTQSYHHLSKRLTTYWFHSRVAVGVNQSFAFRRQNRSDRHRHLAQNNGFEFNSIFSIWGISVLFLTAQCLRSNDQLLEDFQRKETNYSGEILILITCADIYCLVVPAHIFIESSPGTRNQSSIKTGYHS